VSIGRHLVVIVAAALALAGCGPSSVSGTSRPVETSQPASSAGSAPHAGAAPTVTAAPPTPHGSSSASRVRSHPTKVLVVIEENHSLHEMLSEMPYLAALSSRYGYATRWHALTHPSEPNYLAIVGGSTFGISDDRPPAQNASKVGHARSVFSQARQAGRSARTYAELMPSRCALRDHGAYAVRHNPWTFFAADRAACRAGDLNTDTFRADAQANRLPNVGLLIPDVDDDAHDASLARADRWLKRTLTPVLASTDFTSGRLVVVVTADEDDRTSGNIVLTSVLTPRVSHLVVKTPLTHYSLTRFLDEVLGVAPLGNARGAPDMGSAFGL